MSAFLFAVGGLLLTQGESIPEALDVILMPLIFVGIGLLLFGIGRHLHLLHLNLVRQLQMNTSDPHGSNADN